MRFIVLLPLLFLGPLNGTATAAVGLIAPGLQPMHLPGEGIVIDPNTHIPGLVAAKTPRRRAVGAAGSAPGGPRRRAEGRPPERARRTRASQRRGRRDPRAARRCSRCSRARRALARAAVLYAPAAIALGLAWRSALAIGFGALALALVAGLSRRAFVPLLVLVFAGALLVLWHWPVTNALATIGPHPDGGHRFYGVTNQVETMLLAPALAGAPLTAPLALVAVGWSRAGADGGGLITYASGYAMLALRAYGRLTPRRVVARGGDRPRRRASRSSPLDAATGGSSHVTHALGGGIFGDLAHRWRVSYDGATRSVGAFIMFASGIAAARRRRARATATSARRRDARRARRLVRRQRHAAGRRALGRARRDRAPRVRAIARRIDSRPDAPPPSDRPAGVRARRLRQSRGGAAASRDGDRNRGAGAVGRGCGEGAVRLERLRRLPHVQARGQRRQGRARTSTTSPPTRRRRTRDRCPSTRSSRSRIPSAYVVPGFPNGVMPPYKGKLTDAQINDLVKFLTTQS